MTPFASWLILVGMLVAIVVLTIALGEWMTEDEEHAAKDAGGHVRVVPADGDRAPLRVTSFASMPSDTDRAPLRMSPEANDHSWQAGGVSWYGEPFHGRTTASGERFDMHALTCAHKTLPFGTMVMLRHGGRSAVCRVNDRGPFAGRREFDLSAGVFAALAPLSAGVIEVEWQVMP